MPCYFRNPYYHRCLYRNQDLIIVKCLPYHKYKNNPTKIYRFIVNRIINCFFIIFSINFQSVANENTKVEFEESSTQQSDVFSALNFKGVKPPIILSLLLRATMIVLVYCPQISKYLYQLKSFSLALNNKLNLLIFLGIRFISFFCFRLNLLLMSLVKIGRCFYYMYLRICHRSDRFFLVNIYDFCWFR